MYNIHDQKYVQNRFMVNRARLQSYYSEELWGAISVYEKFARNSIKHDIAPDEQ